MNGQQNTQDKSSGFFEKIKDKVGEARNKIKNALSPNPKTKLDNSENGGDNESREINSGGLMESNGAQEQQDVSSTATVAGKAPGLGSTSTKAENTENPEETNQEHKTSQLQGAISKKSESDLYAKSGSHVETTGRNNSINNALVEGDAAGNQNSVKSQNEESEKGEDPGNAQRGMKDVDSEKEETASDDSPPNQSGVGKPSGKQNKEGGLASETPLTPSTSNAGGPTSTEAKDTIENEGLGGQSKMEPSRDFQEDDNGKPSGDQKKEDSSASVELRTGHDQTNAGQQLPQSNDDKSVKEDAVVDHSSPDESANGSRSDSDTKSESTGNQVGTIEQPAPPQSTEQAPSLGTGTEGLNGEGEQGDSESKKSNGTAYSPVLTTLTECKGTYQQSAHSNELEEKGTEQNFSDFSVGGGEDDSASKPLVISSNHKKQLPLKQKQLIGGGFATGGGGIIFAALATVVIFLEKGAALAGKLSTKDAGITYLSLATVLLFAAVICSAVARWGVKENQKQLPESKITSDCAGSTSSIEMS